MLLEFDVKLRALRPCPPETGHAEVHELQRGVTTGSHTARSGVVCDAKIGAVGGVHQMLGWVATGSLRGCSFLPWTSIYRSLQYGSSI